MHSHVVTRHVDYAFSLSGCTRRIIHMLRRPIMRMRRACRVRMCTYLRIVRSTSDCMCVCIRIRIRSRTHIRVCMRNRVRVRIRIQICTHILVIAIMCACDIL